MGSYTKKEILTNLNKIEDISQIYCNKMMNYRGTTKDTKQKYTEVIAEEIAGNPKYHFDTIPTIERKRGYRVSTHTGTFNPKSNRTEELIAMKMFQKEYPDIGKMIDYQIPLKDKSSTKAGKIDLISYKEENHLLYLIELKNNVSKETLLRCVLEIITYFHQVNQEQLKRDFALAETVEVRPAILIFEHTSPYYDLGDKYVTQLIEKYHIDIFIAKETFSIEKQ